MNVWVELQGYDPTRALKLAGNIYSNLGKVFSIAREFKIPTSAAADRIAEERLAQRARVKTGLLSRAVIGNHTVMASRSPATTHV